MQNVKEAFKTRNISIDAQSSLFKGLSSQKPNKDLRNSTPKGT